jgi:5'-phosphate synthase pdxT subunit
MKPTIGVLALQGDFREHARALTRCGAGTIEVRHSHQLDRVDGLVIPGGESTAIDTLCKDNLDPIFARIKQLGASGLPIYGTCMGSIFLATEIEGSTQGRLALMDIKVRRNAFGPQRYSFETDLVFIRAPMILSCGSRVQVLAELEDGIAMARQGNLLVTTFHPEITSDSRVHQYFVDMVQAQRQTTAVQAPQLVAV